jgi:hypothetical protein
VRDETKSETRRVAALPSTLGRVIRASARALESEKHRVRSSEGSRIVVVTLAGRSLTSRKAAVWGLSRQRSGPRTRLTLGRSLTDTDNEWGRRGAGSR